MDAIEQTAIASAMIALKQLTDVEFVKLNLAVVLGRDPRQNPGTAAIYEKVSFLFRPDGTVHDLVFSAFAQETERRAATKGL